MTQFNIHSAKTNLSKLIEAALAGDEVIIARGTKPVVRLVPIPDEGFKLGILKKELGATPDFLAPLSDDDLDAWEGA
ncbi:MAG: type II toxin-antitoxin system Phd/YefM family antitoxin [Roseovarius sp.]